MPLDVWPLVVRLHVWPLLPGAVAQQVSFDLWLLAGCLHVWPLLPGAVAKQMRLDVLCLGSGRCLLVCHYSSFQRRIDPTISSTRRVNRPTSSLSSRKRQSPSTI